jgi:hypothetical protein
MTAKIEPEAEAEAEAFAKATANPPFLFGLGPDKGRETVDEVQSGPMAKLPINVEEQTIPGGPRRVRTRHGRVARGVRGTERIA